MGKPAVVTYAPRPDTTPEAELSALVSAYAFILDSKESAAGVTSTNGDDAKKGSLKHEVRAKTVVQQRPDGTPELFQSTR